MNESSVTEQVSMPSNEDERTHTDHTEAEAELKKEDVKVIRQGSKIFELRTSPKVEKPSELSKLDETLLKYNSESKVNDIVIQRMKPIVVTSAIDRKRVEEVLERMKHIEKELAYHSQQMKQFDKIFMINEDQKK